MSFEVQESQRIVTITLIGAISEEDTGSFLQEIKMQLQRAPAPMAVIIDLSASDGGTAKNRNSIGEFFGAKMIRFGICAGIAVVAKSAGQHSFIRGVLAMGPMPCAYRIFETLGEASTWGRMRIKAVEPPRAAD
jgi:hypothetical protein